MTYQPVHKIIRYTGVLKENDRKFYAQVPDNQELNHSIIEQSENQSILKTEPEEQPSALLSFLSMMLPLLIIDAIFFFILTRAQGGGGVDDRVTTLGRSKDTGRAHV